MPAEDHQRLKWLLSFMRAKFTVWGQVVLGMLLIGMMLSAVGTQISAYLFVSLAVSLYLTASILSWFSKPTVTAVRSLMPSPTAGDIYTYRVTVTNTGRKPLRNIQLFLHKLPYGLYSAAETFGQTDLITWLDPGENAVLTIALRVPHRGSYLMPPLLAGTSFPSGLVRSLKHAAGTDAFIVLPKLLKIDGSLTLLNQSHFAEGEGTASSFVAANEFLSTREYRAGDRLRDIHWNSTARTGRLIVKEYIQNKAIHAGLLLDTELKRYEKHLDFEARIALCAGIAEDLYKKNYTVDLFLNDGVSAAMHCGEGQQGFRSLLEALAGIEGVNEADFSPVLADLENHHFGLSALMVFLKDWDKSRATFVQMLKKMAIPLKVMVVRGKPLSLKLDDPSVSVYTPKQLGFRLKP